MGVGCKLVQFVVCRVLFVMMSANTEKNSTISEEGHVSIAKKVQRKRKQGRRESNPVLLHVQATP